MISETQEGVLEGLIEEKLNATRERCKFKRAWIPEGWACVEVREFSVQLAQDIRKALEEKEDEHCTACEYLRSKMKFKDRRWFCRFRGCIEDPEKKTCDEFRKRNPKTYHAGSYANDYVSEHDKGREEE